MKIDELQFDEQGLVPAVVQEADTDEVLMMGFMNAESLRMTYEKQLVTFWSRSRQELWTKGETSGNRLRLVKILYNCEENTLLVKARLDGDAVCHTGNRTCYFRELEPRSADTDRASYVVRSCHTMSSSHAGGGRRHRRLHHHAYTRAASREAAFPFPEDEMSSDEGKINPQVSDSYVTNGGVRVTRTIVSIPVAGRDRAGRSTRSTRSAVSSSRRATSTRAGTRAGTWASSIRRRAPRSRTLVRRSGRSTIADGCSSA